MDFEIVYSGPPIVIGDHSMEPKNLMTPSEFRAWAHEVNKAADAMLEEDRRKAREKERQNRESWAGLLKAVRQMDAESKNQPEDPRRDFEIFLRSLPTDRDRSYWQRRAGPGGIVRADAPPECRTGD